MVRCPVQVARSWFRGSLAAVDDDELAHHASVFVFEDVAVEHVGRYRVGVVGEAGDDPH